MDGYAASHQKKSVELSLQRQEQTRALQCTCCALHQSEAKRLEEQVLQLAQHVLTLLQQQAAYEAVTTATLTHLAQQTKQLQKVQQQAGVAGPASPKQSAAAAASAADAGPTAITKSAEGSRAIFPDFTFCQPSPQSQQQQQQQQQPKQQMQDQQQQYEEAGQVQQHHPEQQQTAQQQQQQQVKAEAPQQTEVHQGAHVAAGKVQQHEQVDLLQCQHQEQQQQSTPSMAHSKDEQQQGHQQAYHKDAVEAKQQQQDHQQQHQEVVPGDKQVVLASLTAGKQQQQLELRVHEQQHLLVQLQVELQQQQQKGSLLKQQDLQEHQPQHQQQAEGSLWKTNRQQPHELASQEQAQPQQHCNQLEQAQQGSQHDHQHQLLPQYSNHAEQNVQHCMLREQPLQLHQNQELAKNNAQLDLQRHQQQEQRHTMEPCGQDRWHGADEQGLGQQSCFNQQLGQLHKEQQHWQQDKGSRRMFSSQQVVDNALAERLHQQPAVQTQQHDQQPPKDKAAVLMIKQSRTNCASAQQQAQQTAETHRHAGQQQQQPPDVEAGLAAVAQNLNEQLEAVQQLQEQHLQLIQHQQAGSALRQDQHKPQPAVVTGVTEEQGLIVLVSQQQLADGLQELERRLLRAVRLEAEAQQHILELRLSATQQKTRGDVAAVQRMVTRQLQQLTSQLDAAVNNSNSIMAVNTGRLAAASVDNSSSRQQGQVSEPIESSRRDAIDQVLCSNGDLSIQAAGLHLQKQQQQQHPRGHEAWTFHSSRWSSSANSLLGMHSNGSSHVHPTKLQQSCIQQTAAETAELPPLLFMSRVSPLVAAGGLATETAISQGAANSVAAAAGAGARFLSPLKSDSRAAAAAAIAAIKAAAGSSKQAAAAPNSTNRRNRSSAKEAAARAVEAKFHKQQKVTKTSRTAATAGALQLNKRMLNDQEVDVLVQVLDALQGND